MWLRSGFAKNLAITALLAQFSTRVVADDVLSTSGFTNCLPNATIKVENANVQYVQSTNRVTFDVSGSSSQIQRVNATIVFTAYGRQVYTNSFDPCNKDTLVTQLCPVPAGTFAAQGQQSVPSNVASQIPSIAFNIPDLDGQATIKLTGGGQDLACVQSGVTNGKTAQVPAVSYVAAGIAGAALVLSAFSAFGSAGTAGASPTQPSFTTVIGWFQSMATNGMLSVQYPEVYRSFTKNFAFSTGLIPLNSMQTSIDNFRNSTGGNLTEDSVQYLKNASLVFVSGSDNDTILKRSIESIGSSYLFERQDGISTDVNGTQTGNATGNGDQKVTHVVHGIQGYVEELTIPQANTFMTVLLIFAIVITSIAAGILLLKVILEGWALFASFPKRLTSFRKRYWLTLGKTITNLILLLYSVWTLYCIFQFTHGDSWAAKLLAGVTLGIFTIVLLGFTIRIIMVVNKHKRQDGDVSALYENKENWVKYSIFYDNYKQGYWWLFMPAIIYMFAKGCVLAAGDGHGLSQTVGQLIIESLFFILLLWSRPFATPAGNWINIIIQVVRVLSVVCILVFVEQLGIAQTTKTVTGVVLIAVQSVLTAGLAILIAVNALITCFRQNPHRKRRKEAEKLNREFDNLTPLDARNSLLLNSMDHDIHNSNKLVRQDSRIQQPMGMFGTRGQYDPVPTYSDAPQKTWRGDESEETLVRSAAPFGSGSHRRDDSQDSHDYERRMSPVLRRPTIPDVGRRVI